VDTLKNVATYLHEYQEYITNLKNNDYSIIGYVRKLNSTETEDIRTRLLRLMCSRLRSRSLFNHVFVSYSCKANDPIYEGDKKRQNKVLGELKADGDMQGKKLKTISL
jgi:hypothetical protein